MEQVATQESTAVNVENQNKLVDVKEMKFGFRTIKDEKTGVTTKRATVEAKIPLLSFEGVVEVLQNQASKEYALMMQGIEDTFTSYIKDLLADNPDITTENFPYEKVTFSAIANQPESERKGRGIPKEIWEDWVKSYVAIMPGLTGMSNEVITKQAAVFAQKLNPLVNHEAKEKILPKMKDMLTIYLNGAGDAAESFQDCVKFLLEKADKILNAEKESNLVANLGF